MIRNKFYPHKSGVVILTGLLIFLFCCSAFAKVKVHPILQKLEKRQNLINLSNYREHNMRGLLKMRVDLSGQVTISVVCIGSEEAKNKLKALGAQIDSAYDNRSIFTAELPVRALKKAGEVEGLRSLKPAFKKKKLLNESVAQIGLPYPPVTPYTGEGVVIGFIDTGIDKNHEDFKDANGNSRILFIWDQLDSGNPPAGFSYGYEWTAADIDLGVCTSIDDDGHGSHVAGIAAGNGRATGNGYEPNRYVGVAPKADIIAVKTSYYDDDIMDGITYIFAKAQSLGKPVVVNMSLSGHVGSHDGTEPMEQLIDSWTGPGNPGKAVVVAAGNEGEDYVHHSGEVSDSNNTTAFKFIVPDYTPESGSGNDLIAIDLWHNGGDSFNLEFKTPRNKASGVVFNPIDDANDFDYYISQDGIIWVQNYIIGEGGKRNIYIEIDDYFSETRYPYPGNWEITITGANIDGADPNNIHGWIGWYTMDDIVHFDPNTGDNYYSVGMPGTSEEAFTIGAYISKIEWTDMNDNPQSYVNLGIDWGSLGDIASFSSWGPTLDGRQKPDLCAPGMGIAAALTENWGDYWYDYYIDRIVEDGAHVILEGTSMACPHAAGAVALAFQQDDSLTSTEIKQLFNSTAEKDAFYDDVEKWGEGKINAGLALGVTNDTDSDGIADNNDNCPFNYNPTQADRNSDGWGDLCECIAANIDDVNLVNFIDFSMFATDWNQNGTTLAGDINGDDNVDIIDLEIITYHWLSECNGE